MTPPDQRCEECGEHANEHGAISHAFVTARAVGVGEVRRYDWDDTLGAYMDNDYCTADVVVDATDYDHLLARHEALQAERINWIEREDNLRETFEQHRLDAHRWAYLRDSVHVVWTARRAEEGDPELFIWSITFPSPYGGEGPVGQCAVSEAVDAALAKLREAAK